MCVLCYEFAEDGHWTDMLASGEGEAVQQPSGGRYRRLAILNAVVEPYGLSVSDPGYGRHVVVSDRKGASEVASGLGALWVTAQRMAPRRIDVLDEALLAVLASRDTLGAQQ